MKVHNIYCGLESRAFGPSEAREAVLKLASEYFPNGHTIIDATGRWQTTDEPTVIVQVWEVDGFGRPPYTGFAGAYKELALQEAVVIISQEAEAVII